MHLTALHCNKIQFHYTVVNYTIIYNMYCTARRCTTLHCTALHCTALYCTALPCTALHCTALYCTALSLTAPLWSQEQGEGRPVPGQTLLSLWLFLDCLKLSAYFKEKSYSFLRHALNCQNYPQVEYVFQLSINWLFFLLLFFFFKLNTSVVIACTRLGSTSCLSCVQAVCVCLIV